MTKEIGNWSKRRPAIRWIGRTPAEIITSRLKRGERLIWSSRGSGHGANRPAPGIANLADLFALLFASMVLALVPTALVNMFDARALPVLMVTAVVILFVLPRSLFGHATMVYGVTDQRIIVVNYLLFGIVVSFERSKIERLLAADFGGRGDVLFRDSKRDNLTFQAPADPGDGLFGIDDPERVARLIQSTLTPNTPVELTSSPRR